MSEPFIGEIKLFAGNFAPRGYALCDGALLPISQYQALFSLLGTFYGGDGRTTFALPDLRGRVPLHFGQGAGLTSRQLGQKVGNETETLTVNQLPSHNHPSASTDTATLGNPAAHVVGHTGTDVLYAEGAPNVSLAPAANQSVGGNQSHNNLMPVLGLYFIIALQGVFPSRN